MRIMTILSVSILFVAAAAMPGQGATLRTQQASYTANEDVIVAYSGFPGNQQDWITVIDASQPDNTYGGWTYLKGEKAGSHNFGKLTPGKYQARGYLNWPDGDYDCVVRYEFSVTAAEKVASALSISARTESIGTAEGRIAYVTIQDNTENIAVIGADGTGYREVTHFSGRLRVGELAVSPDSKQIAFAIDGKESGLYVANLDGSGSKMIKKNDILTTTHQPAWSADGTLIVFARGSLLTREICVVAPDGTGFKQLTSFEADKTYPAWSPSGKQIVFLSKAPDGTPETGGNYVENDIWTMNMDGSNQKNLTSFDGDDTAAVWSPDGKKIAFVRTAVKSKSDNVRVMDSPEIFVMNADGTALKNLSQNSAWDMEPAWSPDGKRIAFVSSRDSGHYSIYAMDADGSNVKRLTQQNYKRDIRPRWSPDGKYIAYLAMRYREAELHVTSSNGTSDVALTKELKDIRWLGKTP